MVYSFFYGGMDESSTVGGSHFEPVNGDGGTCNRCGFVGIENFYLNQVLFLEIDDVLFFYRFNVDGVFLVVKSIFSDGYTIHTIR